MKKTYQQPSLAILAVDTPTLMAGSNKSNQATIGNENENGTGDKTIGEVGDGDGFTMEAKKYSWDDLSDWGE